MIDLDTKLDKLIEEAYEIKQQLLHHNRTGEVVVEFDNAELDDLIGLVHGARRSEHASSYYARELLETAGKLEKILAASFDQVDMHHDDQYVTLTIRVMIHGD